MLITILYSLWIAYTVGSLSIIGFLTILSIYAKWENKKHREKLDKLLSQNKTDLEEDSW